MTIEINWWMLSPLAAICLTTLAYRQAKNRGTGQVQGAWTLLLMILTLIFTARFLP